MADERIDGWLLYDFRGNNPIFAQLLPGKRSTTRRAFLFVPARGEPAMLVNPLDAHFFAGAGVELQQYIGWRDLHAWLAGRLAAGGRIAMEYSPGNALPVVSIVDAGTVDLVRSFGAEVVSSANLIQVQVAVWSVAARERHAHASERVAAIKDGAFELIRARLSAGAAVHEYEVQQHITAQFRAAGLEYPDDPIVAVNAHSGNPHFEVTAAGSAPIRKGDWVLIDLWARVPGDENIYSDITWVGYAGPQPSSKHREVFEVVRAARDAAVTCARNAWRQQLPLQGWQVDDAARGEIERAGYSHGLKHRTGHSLSPGPKVHGVGVNIDNLETHDTRALLPGIGFTVEPGIYLPEFGVRLEINVFMDPAKGPTITSCLQDDILRLA